MQDPVLHDLLTLSHEIGREDRGLAILGEGNTSTRLSEENFLVKASGTCLGSLREEVWTKGRLAARVREGKAASGVKYSDYFDFSQPPCRPGRCGRSRRFDTIPSRPIAQALSRNRRP